MGYNATRPRVFQGRFGFLFFVGTLLLLSLLFFFSLGPSPLLHRAAAIWVVGSNSNVDNYNSSMSIKKINNANGLMVKQAQKCVSDSVLVSSHNQLGQCLLTSCGKCRSFSIQGHDNQDDHQSCQCWWSALYRLLQNHLKGHPPDTMTFTEILSWITKYADDKHEEDSILTSNTAAALRQYLKDIWPSSPWMLTLIIPPCPPCTNCHWRIFTKEPIQTGSLDYTLNLFPVERRSIFLQDNSIGILRPGFLTCGPVHLRTHSTTKRLL